MEETPKPKRKVKWWKIAIIIIIAIGAIVGSAYEIDEFLYRRRSRIEHEEYQEFRENLNGHWVRMEANIISDRKVNRLESIEIDELNNVIFRKTNEYYDGILQSCNENKLSVRWYGRYYKVSGTSTYFYEDMKENNKLWQNSYTITVNEKVMTISDDPDFSGRFVKQ